MKPAESTPAKAIRTPDGPTIHDGMIHHPEGCPRGKTDCWPLARVAAEGNVSFMCCGENDGTNRAIPGDRFRLCMKSCEGIDHLANCDERDLTDYASVILGALSSDANDKANGGDSP